MTGGACDPLRILRHLLGSVEAARAETNPFGHTYFENLLPIDTYREVLANLPRPDEYIRASERHYSGEVGGFVRWHYPLTRGGVAGISAIGLWGAVATALTSPELKRAVFSKLAPDLAYRYSVPTDAVPDLAGFSRPTLYRETEGFEIPPHPDTRRKVVTMHLYFPEDESQIDLGTALYRRRPLALPFGDWHGRFEKVKQFPFRPNSGYAFAVNNTVWKRSWHGRERLPSGAGMRNTLLNTFYETPAEGFGGYLTDTPAADPMRRVA